MNKKNFKNLELKAKKRSYGECNYTWWQHYWLSSDNMFN